MSSGDAGSDAAAQSESVQETESAVLNHFGLCVTDLERSIRFYTELFGFTVRNRTEVPDNPTARLLRVEPPVGLTAVYLKKAGSVLELLHYDRPGNAPVRERPMTEPGLTHLSFCVDNLAAARRLVAELGGEVLDGTDVGVALFVRDPDGQLVELIDMAYRSSLA